MVGPSDQRTTRPIPRARWAGALLAVFLAAGLPRLPAVDGEPVWIDHHEIEAGRALRPLAELAAHFTHGHAGTGYYRPLVGVSLSLEAALFGHGRDDMRGFRLLGLAWHGLAAIAVLLALRCLLGDRRRGVGLFALTAGALLFAWHPATSLSAQVPTYRTDVMALAFALLALWAHARARARGGRASDEDEGDRPVLGAAATLAAGLLLLASALSKETGLLWGAGLVALFEWRRYADGDPTEGRGAKLGLFAVEVGAFIIYAVLRARAIGEPWRVPRTELPWAEALGTRLANFALEMTRLFVPHDRSVHDVVPIVPLASPRAWAGLALTVALAALAVVLWRRQRRGADRPTTDERGPAARDGLVLLGLLALGAVPLVHAVPVAHFRSLHYLYVLVLIPAGIITVACDRLRASRPRLAPLLALAVLAPLLVLTAVDAPRYVSDERLFAPEVAAEPRFREGHAFLGDRALARGDLDGAERHYRAALARPAQVIAYVNGTAVRQNLALLAIRRGGLDEAERLLAEALAGAKERPSVRREIVHNLAVVASERKDWARVVELLGPEARRDDAPPSSWLLLGEALGRRGRYAEALELFRRAEPRLPEPDRSRVKEVLRRAATRGR